MCLFLTSGMELYKLQILAGQAGSGHHCISISSTSVSRGAAEIGSSVTPGNKDIFGYKCTAEDSLSLI